MKKFKYYKRSILVFVCFALLGCVTDKNGCLPFGFDETTAYAFKIPVSITQAKQQLTLGDTLFIKVAMNDSVQDAWELKRAKHITKYKLTDFPLYVTPMFEKVADNLSTATYFSESIAENDIEVIMINGLSEQVYDKAASPNAGMKQLVNYVFKYNDPTYELVLAIIPKKKGTFLVNFIDPKIAKGSFPWLCPYVPITPHVEVNNGKSNYEIIQQKISEHKSNWLLAIESREVWAPAYMISNSSVANYWPPRILALDYCFVVN